jgi:hypothetical protein
LVTFFIVAGSLSLSCGDHGTLRDAPHQGLMGVLLLPPLVVAVLGLPAQQTAEPPAIDGRLDEAAWTAAPASDAFTQRFPDERQPPTERTTVRVLFDHAALYVGIVCEHRRTPVYRRLTRRDRELSDADLVAVTISSRGDGASAFRFAVSAAGVLSDGIYFNDTSYDSSWDENWEASTSASGDGWTAEFRIPLRVLRFGAASQWGFNVERLLAARQETDVWAYIPRTEAGYVSRLGHLDGLVALPSSNAVAELRPFVVTRVGRQDAAFGLPRGSSNPATVARSWRGDGGATLSAGVSIGLDGRVHLTRDLTLDATVNPDFAQVEADQLILNLTTVETLYPEKRPFFLEGLDIFATPLAVLYTRRIGTVPPPSSLPKGETALEDPGPSAIPVAAKVVGRIGAASLGVLSAFTAANRIQVSDEEGGGRWRLADPATAFNVLRSRAPIPGGHFGFIAAATNRIEQPSLYSATADGEVACPGSSTPRVGATCFRDSYVAGVDGRWQSPAKNYAVETQTVFSVLAGGQPQRLRDGTRLAAGAVGAGTNLNLSKPGGRHFLWTLNVNHFTRQLQLNDAGFLARQNYAGGRFDLYWVTREPWGPTLESDTDLGLRHSRNLDGLILENYAVLKSSARLRNQWRLWGLVQYRNPYFDDREVGDGTALQRAGQMGAELQVDGDPRRPVAPHLWGRVWRLTNGWYADLLGGIVFRAHPQLDLELLPQAAYSAGEPRYVGEPAPGRLLFGRLDALSLGGTLRATFTFTTRLSLQGYGQLFLARGRYSEFSTFERAPGTRPAIRLSDLLPGGAAPADGPDFQQAAFNASVVLRWEFRLGSTLYLVYSRSQKPTVPLEPDERPTLDLRALPRAPAADVFLVKATFWWG